MSIKEQMNETEELDTETKEFINQLVEAILFAVQAGGSKETIKEAAKELKECPSDISNILPYVNTKGWGEPARRFKTEVGAIAKNSSLDTRRELRLSFPPSHFSTTDDPVSLTFEGCYDATSYFTTLIYACPEIKNALIEAMKAHGVDEDNAWDLVTREWKLWSHMMHLPEVADITRAMPAYEDYNRGKPNNYSLISAARKIEHTVGGKIVPKISIETGGTDENGNGGKPLEIAATDDVIEDATNKIYAEECLAILDETDREIMLRHADGETYASLAKAFGYKTAGGMQKHIKKIKNQIADRMG